VPRQQTLANQSLDVGTILASQGAKRHKLTRRVTLRPNRASPVERVTCARGSAQTAGRDRQRQAQDRDQGAQLDPWVASSVGMRWGQFVRAGRKVLVCERLCVSLSRVARVPFVALSVGARCQRRAPADVVAVCCQSGRQAGGSPTTGHVGRSSKPIACSVAICLNTLPARLAKFARRLLAVRAPARGSRATIGTTRDPPATGATLAPRTRFPGARGLARLGHNQGLSRCGSITDHSTHPFVLRSSMACVAIRARWYISLTNRGREGPCAENTHERRLGVP
jgi:hypothetical protein